MTTREAIYESWVLAGEPSDHDPLLATAISGSPEELDATSEGVRHYLRQLSQAQNILANWKTSRGRPIRFKRFQTQRNVKLGLSEVNREHTLTWIDNSTFRIDTVPAWMVEEMFDTVRMDLTISGSDPTTGLPVVATETVMVMQGVLNGAGNMELFLRDEITPVTFTPTSYTGEIYFDRYRIVQSVVPGNGSALSLPPSVRNITRMTEAENGGNLKPVAAKTDLYNPAMTLGIPSEYYILGERVFFDVYLEEPRWFIVEYQRLPNTLTNIDDVLDIPEEWHSVLMAIMEWREAERMMDTEKGMVKRSQITSLVNTLRTEEEEEWLRNQTAGFYVQMEAN